MATALPTITVTDAQAARILEAYKAKFGTTTTAETVAAYKRELALHVRDVVLAHEESEIDKTNRLAKRDQLRTLSGELPDPNTVS